MKHQALLAVAASSLAKDWDAAYSKASSALQSLSLAEKVGIVTGIGWQNGPCVGNTSPAPAIGFPQLCLQDGPLGTRFASAATAFPPAIQAAATWDRALIRDRGAFMAREARALGVHVLLGPCVGPLGKIPRGGRGWEGWGPDPYLAGVGAAETVAAMQREGVQATVKHWLMNEQELERESISADAPGRTARELYAWPFADALRAGAAAVMCSYNRINGTFACESDEALAGLLKHEMGFRGYVLTDWNAQHSTSASAAAGLDMAMPGDDYAGGHVWWGPQLEDAVRQGNVSAERVDDMVTRVLAGWYLTGQDGGDFPTIDLRRDVQADAHRQNARAVARDGIVLLKNEGGVLPLRNPNVSIAVIGSGAVAGRHARNDCEDMGCNDGALGMGWGSGSMPYPYFIAPHDAIRERVAAAAAEGAAEGVAAAAAVTLSATDDPAAAAAAARGADLALVFLTADSGEGYISVEGSAGDRPHLDPWHGGNELVAAAASASANVVVVVHSVGPVVLESVLAHESVRAVVWAGLPSQESGNALADVLWGDASPSGKLVYTIARREEDYGTQVMHGRDPFEEGLLVDYRAFDARSISPRYEFGFGLSYTEFAYSALKIRSSATPGPAAGPIEPGGPADLFDVVATVTVRVKNTGRVAGAEVAQLYLAHPGAGNSSNSSDSSQSADSAATPPRQLRGFAKLHLASGQTGTATFELRRRDLSYWDAARGWVLPEGDFEVLVGASSRDVRMRGVLSVLRPRGGAGLTGLGVGSLLAAGRKMDCSSKGSKDYETETCRARREMAKYVEL
ncbi:putative beta-glucosidase L [Escovopsis weberi]|uniref:Beta-glucosidase cel3A n=1 Tax=Escovopsis weberi TaxID=150374 RepID=A0A0M8MX52_ESCWE|nr:putative beta-glucosidase L [Escovopsis weberi]